MEKGHIAGYSPIKVSVEEGKKYAWCTCGLSTNQPFCDGKHKADGKFTPTMYVAEETKDVHFCTCKQTTRENGLCDGTHKSLERKD
jgi:CDGSH-type Zn-finger protein